MIYGYLEKILSARYGKDVRQAIHDGIKQCYYDGKAGSIDMAARESIEKLNADFEELSESGITQTTETTIPNSHSGRLKIDEIGGGETEQETTAGNQLFDNAIAIAQGGINSSGSSYSAEGYLRVNGYIPVSGTSVTVACNVPIFRVFRYSGTTNDSFISYLHAQSATELIVPLTEDTAYIRISFVNEDTTATDATIKTASSTLMVNYGDVALPWEQYTGGQPAPNPSYPMEIKKSVVSGVRTHKKNFLDCRRFTDISKNGGSATIKKYNNGSVKYIEVNGTFTADTYILIGDLINEDYLGKSFIANGCPSGGGESTYFMQVNRYNASGELTGVRDNGNGVNFSFQTIARASVYIAIKSGYTATNLRFYPMIREASVEDATYEPYTSSEYTFSQPIELYGMNGVQDVITAKQTKGKFVHVVYDGDENWKTSSSLVGRYFLDNVYCKHYGSVLCTQAMGVTVATATVNQCYISTANNINGRFLINTEFATVDEWKAHLASKPMEVFFELAEEVTEELPIADQIGLNSLATYDGITYVEFIYEGPQPTFKGEYGTSKVGGYALEGLLVARNNELRITALETA